MIEPYFYWMVLNFIYGIGPKTLSNIFSINKRLGFSISDLFMLSETELERVYGFKPSIRQKIKSHKKLHKKVLKTIKDLHNKGVRIISIDDPDYPLLLLKFLKLPPTVLYLYGNAELLKKQTAGIFASRSLSWNSIFIAEKICNEMSENDRPLIVGTSKEIYEYVSYETKKRRGENIIIVNFGVYDSKLNNLESEFRSFAQLINKEFDIEKNLVISFVNPEYGWSISTEKEKNDIIFVLSDYVFGLEIRKNGIIYRNFVNALGEEKKLYVVEYDDLSVTNRKIHRELIAKGCISYPVVPDKVHPEKVNWRQLKRNLIKKESR
ncbi:DNA-processing protein DprA [candidate division KSB1 bacterium]